MIYYRMYGKRIFDLLFLMLIFPFILVGIFIVSFMVYIKFGRPVLFKQMRPGLKGKPFMIHKFRTMSNLKDNRGNLLPDRERLTSFGEFLRSTSLDEFPEIYNVFKGDMSFVGPRPLLTKYMPLYNREQRHRHDVKPGITGWAQVNGRNDISWEKKFSHDIWYVDNMSIMLDIRILALTIRKVLKREGINKKGNVTTEEFKGTFRSTTDGR